MTAICLGLNVLNSNIKFQSDWTTETEVMDGRDVARFEFKMSYGRMSYITQHHANDI